MKVAATKPRQTLVSNSGASRPDPVTETTGVGLLGMGVVGSAVARALSEKSDDLAALAGRRLTLNGVLVRDVDKPRTFQVPSELLTADAESVIGDEGTDVVVEAMGGEHPALEYITRSISLGKHVVTANKEVMALHGPELLALAAKHDVWVLFEATVAAGTPVIAPLTRDLVANEVLSVRGIVNGTTNYILTRMADDGLSLDAALGEAQELGYAEPDPTGDVDGTDAARKLAILASLAFGTTVRERDVYREGVDRLTARDFDYASELGYTIKLIAVGRRENGGLQVRVHPALVDADTSFARVNGVTNAVVIDTDMAGPVLFQGAGAGPSSTASAVLGDLVEVARDVASGGHRPASAPPGDQLNLQPMDLLESRYYLRLTIVDGPGVLARIATALGDRSVGIDTVSLKPAVGAAAGTVDLVITTLWAKESAIQEALRQIGELAAVREVGNLIRIDGPSK